MNWQPIETHPGDDWVCLVWIPAMCPEFRLCLRAKDDDGSTGWYGFGDDCGPSKLEGRTAPTHWLKVEPPQ